MLIMKTVCAFLFLVSLQETIGSSVYQIGFNCNYHGRLFNVGETWSAMDGCNTCSCHVGKLVVQMTCTEKPCGQAGQCVYHGTSYKSGESFPSIDKCNTCFCSDNGNIGCTERFCLLNEHKHILPPSVIGSKRSSVWQHGFHCRYNNRVYSVGDTWTATDGCNTCACHAGDILVRRVCTENPCVVPGQCIYHGKTYKTGESFPSIDKCNTCGCSSNGAVMCTEKFCLLNGNKRNLDSPRVVRSSVWQRGFNCHYHNRQFNVGETWKAIDGCNTCSCHAGDLIVRLVCTENPCGGSGQCMYHGKSYKTGESFPSIDKCNTCSCGDDGSIMCTEMACLLNGNRGNVPLSEIKYRSAVMEAA